MPIPEFSANGLLPAGIHDCTLEELAARFGIFQGNEQRPKLMGKLAQFISEAATFDFVRWIIVDGSFATANRSPNDVDLIVVVAADHDFQTDITPTAYNVLSKLSVRRRYGFDMLVAREGSIEADRWISFFQQVRLEPGLRKGILRLRP